MLNRRRRKSRNTESSDDEINANGALQINGSGGRNYRDLETFQKAQLRQKVKYIISYNYINVNANVNFFIL